MLKQITLFVLLIGLSLGATQAQVSNITANHDAVNDKYIIIYDLAKQDRYDYFDVEVIASIGGIEVRPSLAALSGDAGLNIKYGRKKRIVWDYLIDIEKIVGEVEFKVFANTPAIPAPPKPVFDYALGGGLSAGGLGLVVMGGLDLLKKNKTDTSADPIDNPITYYYTFCDTDLVSHDLTLSEVPDENTESFCDEQYERARDEYRTASIQTSIGLGLLAGGLYVLLAKPFYKPKMKAYRKKHDLTIRPTFEWQQSVVANAIPQGVIGGRLTYKFGR